MLNIKTHTLYFIAQYILEQQIRMTWSVRFYIIHWTDRLIHLSTNCKVR